MSFTPGFGTQSTLNTTTTPLGAGATYTGTFEQNYAPWVGVSCKTDVAGTLYFDFSNDGSNVDTFPPVGFSVSAGVHEFHTAVKLPRFFRVRFVNAGGAQSYLRLYTYFGTFDQGIAPINFDIADDADARVVKSVISGIGNTTATVTDHKSLQVTPPAEGKSAFGEQLSSSLEPVVQLLFTYSVNPYQVNQFLNGGTAAVSTAMLALSTGAAANQSACIESVNTIRYEPGLGVCCRFTGIFTAGVANSEQIIGVGDIGEGFYFGYNGTDFGILRRYGGTPEVRTLTVTTGSSTAENITITLDGNADATVAVTNTGDTTQTANEIAAHDFSGLGRGWKAVAEGSKVIFTSYDASSRTGTYSLSGATTAVGTFAQTVAGVASTSSWVAQSSWNGLDIFDGNGLTGVTLDPTKGNVFQIDFQYLGFGLIRFFIEDPDDGELHLVHSIEYANANTRPSLDNPSMRLRACAENTSNTSDIVLKSASMAAFVQGNRKVFGVNRGIKHTATISSSGETPLTSIKISEVFNSKLNRSQAKLMYVAAACEHTKPVFMNFYANPILVGASFSTIDSGNSTILQDTSATAISGGLFLFSLPLGKNGNEVIDLKDDLGIGIFGPGDILSIAVEYGSGTNADAFISLNFTEMI